MKNVKKAGIFALLCSAILLASFLFERGDAKEVTFVILSTNDMHSQIERYPLVAEAVKQCRDTVDVVMVDAGDRWTGNAFVDRVEYYTPVYDFMRAVGYNVGIYGNHEFDKGNAYLSESERQASYEMLCANVKSSTTAFPQPLAHYSMEVEGKRITFVGVVGNYDGDGHPAGKSESYEGLKFIDPIAAAGEYAHLREESDMLVLLSHCGLDRDVEFAEAESSEGYDLIIGGHSHDAANEVVDGKLIVQSGSRLKNIGATTVTITKDGEVKLSYQNISLDNYSPDADMQELMAGYMANKELTSKIGEARERFNTVALQNMFAERIRKKMNANIGVYHRGGVRLEEIPAGDLSVSTVLNIEPFNSHIAMASMTMAQLKKLILTKFNDTQNVGEANSIDILMTTPYTVLTNADGVGVDVDFPRLSDKRLYRVAMGDYIYKTYKGLEKSAGEITDILITDVLEAYIRGNEYITPDSTIYQTIAPLPVEEE